MFKCIDCKKEKEADSFKKKKNGTQNGKCIVCCNYDKEYREKKKKDRLENMILIETKDICKRCDYCHVEKELKCFKIRMNGNRNKICLECCDYFNTKNKIWKEKNPIQEISLF